MNEVWKEVGGFDGDYEVSNYGRVKSFKRYKKGKILEPGKDSNGYLQVNLYNNKKPHPKSIHRLVLEAFKPNKDLTKTEGNHLDGNKKNNYVGNLEWCTHSENLKHAYKLGLMIPMKGQNHPFYGKKHLEEERKKQSETRKELFRIGKLNLKGEKNPRSKLTDKKVIKIWKYINEGILTQKEIGEIFSVHSKTISKIKTRKTWKHIKIK